MNTEACVHNTHENCTGIWLDCSELDSCLGRVEGNQSALKDQHKIIFHAVRRLKPLLLSGCVTHPLNRMEQFLSCTFKNTVSPCPVFPKLLHRCAPKRAKNSKWIRRSLSWSCILLTAVASFSLLSVLHKPQFLRPLLIVDMHDKVVESRKTD
jgi:hypothetical protein